MSLLKKDTLERRKATKSASKKMIESIPAYKSKVVNTSFPQKIEKANSLLSKAKLMK
jgi:hypothetical protein